MDIVFFVLFLIFLIALIVGIIKPDLVLRWGSEGKKTRKCVLKYYGIGMILFFILFAVNVQNSNIAKDNVNKSTSVVEQKVAADKKLATDLDTKIAAFGDINSITLDKAVDIQLIRTAYEALTADQKGLVTKLDTLTAAEDKVANLQIAADKAAADKAAADKAAADKAAADKAAADKVAADKVAADEAAAAVKSTPTPSKNNEYTVYITETGSKYHRDGCRYLRKSKIAISKSDAISEGYSPCSICNP